MIDPQDIAQVRAFNRFYTRVIGLLDEGMHQTAHSLAEARVIYELDQPGTTTAAQIAARLQMDRGQLSRLLARLVDQGLVTLLPAAPDDRRTNPLALTADGQALARRFNAMSDQAAARTLLEPFAAFERRDMVDAMRRIQALLSEPSTAPGALLFRPHRIGELGWLVHRQAVLYHLEQGWNGEFETLIARLYADYETAAGPKSLWIAEQEGEVAGSVYVLPATDRQDTAQLRMLYVEPMFRGLGIGRKLVDLAVAFARSSGYGRIILWTQDCLMSARRIYQGAGFTLEREEQHHAFGADLNGQFWGLDLEGRPPG